MKKSCLWMLALLVLFASGVHSQDIAGQWQGTLKAGGRELRIVIRIASAGGDLSGVLYSIDQGGQPVATSAVSVQNGAVKFKVPALNGAYEGRLNATDGIDGTLTQGTVSMPLNLVRVTGDAAWAIPPAPAALRPMAADAKPVFDVATIKPSNPAAVGRLYTMQGRQMRTVNTSVKNLLTFAYSLHEQQIIGGPAWLDSAKYDVLGQPDIDGLPTLDQMRHLIAGLLADRFKLTMHREQKELPVYALVVGSKGPTLTKSAGAAGAPPTLLFRGPGVLPARNAAMAEFASVMQTAVLERPVVDRTGLKGKYDFTLNWTPDERQQALIGRRPANDNNPPELFTAIQEQLGLKFESSRAAVDVIVIDTIERPTEN